MEAHQHIQAASKERINKTKTKRKNNKNKKEHKKPKQQTKRNQKETNKGTRPHRVRRARAKVNFQAKRNMQERRQRRFLIGTIQIQASASRGEERDTTHAKETQDPNSKPKIMQPINGQRGARLAVCP